MGPVHLLVPAGLEVQARLILAAPSEPIDDDEHRPTGARTSLDPAEEDR